MHPHQIILAPIVSEKSYHGSVYGKYTFRVHEDAHRTQIRDAIEQLFEVNVVKVNVLKVQAKPKRRGMIKGTKRGWKKAVVQLKPGQTIEVFQGAQIVILQATSRGAGRAITLRHAASSVVPIETTIETPRVSAIRVLAWLGASSMGIHQCHQENHL